MLVSKDDNVVWPSCSSREAERGGEAGGLLRTTTAAAGHDEAHTGAGRDKAPQCRQQQSPERVGPLAEEEQANDRLDGVGGRGDHASAPREKENLIFLVSPNRALSFPLLLRF